MGASMQPKAPNPPGEYPAKSGMALSKMSENEAPAVPEGSQSGHQNPSIARSMSRYRRNRPGAHGIPSVPAIPRHATAPPPTSLPSQPKQQLAEDEQAREWHRQNTIDQLTGGTQPNRSISLPTAELEQETARAKDLSHKAPVHETTYPETHHQADSSGGESTRKSFFQKVKLAKTKKPVEQNEPRYIGVGGGGIVPGTDAPISAVNAGQRLVRVKYNDTTMDFAITPATQVQDVLLAASQLMSNDIDHEKFILLESFRQIGLQRPLRRYEHVREVMNSWESDSASHLIIIPPSSTEALARLDIQQVPSEQPSGITVELYHSQRPRKWDKRFVTLRTNGQVVVSKKENGKDATNICHLSDYDIYSPSPRALNKDIKPPKRICLAIKSQEKSAMFLNTEKFVHFFATNDRSIADKWHQAVQEWRSWYVVHKLGAGKVVDIEAVLAKQSSTQKKASRPRKPSHDEPAIDELSLDDEPPAIRNPFELHRPSSSKELFSLKRATREHVPPPTSRSKALRIDTDFGAPTTDSVPLVTGLSAKEVEAAAFAPAGLLGHTYTQRRHAMREREEREKREKEEPFSPHGLVGRSHLHHAAPHHQQARIQPGADAPSLLGRTNTVGQKFKPLVDLTPVFHEPPQHTRRGRGVTVEAGVPLIEGATGPALAPGAVAIPPATAWRRPSAEPWQTRSRANTARSMRSERYCSQTGRSAGSISAGASPTSPGMPFMPNSLLAGSARSPSGQGQTVPGRGHGVATGDRNATRPLLDLSPENPFAEGSLLGRL